MQMFPFCPLLILLLLWLSVNDALLSSRVRISVYSDTELLNSVVLFQIPPKIPQTAVLQMCLH